MKWLRIGLEIVGAVALLAAFVLAVLLYRQSFSDRVNAASKRDALYALNWGGISTNQDFKMISSYQSSRNVTGDHVDYYCIQLTNFEIEESMKDEWHDGPETNPLLAGALELALDSTGRHGNCLPSFEKANSPAMKIRFISVVLRDHFATAADILLYEPQSRRLFYVSFKT